jgi:hypothetical protein
MATNNNPSAAALALGMSVPGASGLMQGGSVADQLMSETEEQRRKRLAMLEQQKAQGGASYLTAGYGAVSAAGSALGLT